MKKSFETQRQKKAVRLTSFGLGKMAQAAYGGSGLYKGTQNSSDVTTPSPSDAKALRVYFNKRFQKEFISKGHFGETFSLAVSVKPHKGPPREATIYEDIPSVWEAFATDLHALQQDVRQFTQTCLVAVLLSVIPFTATADESSPNMSIYQRLEANRRPDGDAAVVADKTGLYILTIPSGEKIVLDSNPVHFSIYDPYLRVIWYATQEKHEKQSIWAFDLLNQVLNPLLVLEKIPRRAFRVSITDSLESSVEECALDGCIELKFDKKKNDFVARLDEEVYDETFSDDKKKTKMFAVKNKEFLRKLISRNYSPPKSDWANQRPAVKKFRPERIGVRCSEDTEDCGKGISFGNTSYFLVMTDFSCGDACNASFQLYDPTQKKFALPSAPQKSAKKPFPEGQDHTRYFFDVSGKYYIFSNFLCNIETGCKKFTGKLGGFIFSFYSLQGP